MKLSVSNIAWTKEYDEEMYLFLQKNGFEGVEIAPTRIWEKAPYDKLKDVSAYADTLLSKYGLAIPSIQSIWFGRTENIFAGDLQREALFGYTKKAIDFADAIHSHNLVFGCPRNRTYSEGSDCSVAIPFFKALGDYAGNHNTVLSMEANPPIYNTNYCNTTKEAIQLVREVESTGFLLNLDMGTMIHGGEDISVLEGNDSYINHVHISEPYLNTVEKRSIHKELSSYLKENDYKGFVSLEVKTQEDISRLKDMLWYIKDVFA